MLNSKLKLTLGLAVLFAASAVTQAQTTPAASPPQSSAFEDFVKQAKNPTDWLTWGADLRLRSEYVNNAATLSSAGAQHEVDYFRFRGRFWTSITPVTNLTLNARLAAEPREWMEPATSFPFSPRPYTPHTANEGLEWRYGILDNLNIQWKKPFDLPVTASVGRQDIFLGDGWLVGDGTPEDGSFTYLLANPST